MKGRTLRAKRLAIEVINLLMEHYPEGYRFRVTEIADRLRVRDPATRLLIFQLLSACAGVARERFGARHWKFYVVNLPQLVKQRLDIELQLQRGESRGHPVERRLEALEQKLDRLLSALGERPHGD